MPTRALVTRYEDDLALFPSVWHKVGLAAFAAFALIFPVLASEQWLVVANLTLVVIVGSVGLMILTGYAGQISLGHAAFLALGAYTVAIAAEQFHLPFWLGIPLGGVVAAAVGLAVGPFALRLRGLYLAIVTLGLLFLVDHVLMATPSLTHGPNGIKVAMHSWFSSAADTPAAGSFSQPWMLGAWKISADQKLYGLFLVIAIATVYVSKNVQRSNLGRAMIAVRDHDLAASILGIRPAHTKIVAFGLSSFLGGIAGGMFAMHQSYITIVPPFDLSMSVKYIAILVLGGIGTTFGAVAGSITYEILTPVVQAIGRQLPLLNKLSSAQQSSVVVSLLVCVLLVVEPLGVLGVWLRIKRYFSSWPFRY